MSVKHGQEKSLITLRHFSRHLFLIYRTVQAGERGRCTYGSEVPYIQSYVAQDPSWVGYRVQSLLSLKIAALPDRDLSRLILE